jgi:hypothetical protein
MIGISISMPGRSGPIPVQARDGQDFTIPPPRITSQRAEPVPTQAAANPFAGLERTATTPDILLGAASLALLAIVFLFVRQGVRVHLINRRATLDAADGASWMLFSALMLTATVLVGATIGRLWQAWAGLTAAFTLCVILFAAALALFLRAPDRRR